MALPSGCIWASRARQCWRPGAFCRTAKRRCCTWRRGPRRIPRAAGSSSMICAGAVCPTRCWWPATGARLLRDDIAVTYGNDLPSAVACLDDDFEACIAHLRFPLGHRRVIRTTNLLERLFGEARRRTKVIPHAFGERAVLKLVYAALIRAAERWRGIRITEFEQRQL